MKDLMVFVSPIDWRNRTRLLPPFDGELYIFYSRDGEKMNHLIGRYIHNIESIDDGYTVNHYEYFDFGCYQELPTKRQLQIVDY